MVKNLWKKSMRQVILCILVGTILTSCSKPNDKNDQEDNDASKYALVDLHLHLDGSLTGGDILEMAHLGNVQLATEKVDELQAMMTCPQDNKDLTQYLKCFDLPVKVMQCESSIAFSLASLVKRLDKQGLIYAEIRFAPQQHTVQGLTQNEVVQAAIDGLNRGISNSNGIKANLILCCMRGENNDDANSETLQVAKKYLNNGVVAIDLAGAEALYPTSKYAALFKRAKEENVPFTIHAGEADGVGSINAALDYGTHRIGHGIRCYNDETTKERLKSLDVCITLCPTSNLQTHALTEVSSLSQYPLPLLITSGVPFTINTDNMTVSNTTLKSEFQKLFNTGMLTAPQAKEIVKRAILHSFLPDAEKAKLLEKARKRMAEN